MLNYVDESVTYIWAFQHFLGYLKDYLVLRVVGPVTPAVPARRVVQLKEELMVAQTSDTRLVQHFSQGFSK